MPQQSGSQKPQSPLSGTRAPLRVGIILAEHFTLSAFAVFIDHLRLAADILRRLSLEGHVANRRAHCHQFEDSLASSVACMLTISTPLSLHPFGGRRLFLGDFEVLQFVRVGLHGGFMDFWRTLQVLRRRWYVLGPALLISAALTVLTFASIPTRYESTGVLVLTSPSTGAKFSESTRPEDVVHVNPRESPGAASRARPG